MNLWYIVVLLQTISTTAMFYSAIQSTTAARLYKKAAEIRVCSGLVGKELVSATELEKYRQVRTK
jgi:hypothetical protein